MSDSLSTVDVQLRVASLREQIKKIFNNARCILYLSFVFFVLF